MYHVVLFFSILQLYISIMKWFCAVFFLLVIFQAIENQCIDTNLVMHAKGTVCQLVWIEWKNVRKKKNTRKKGRKKTAQYERKLTYAIYNNNRIWNSIHSFKQRIMPEWATQEKGNNKAIEIKPKETQRNKCWKRDRAKSTSKEIASANVKWIK